MADNGIVEVLPKGLNDDQVEAVLQALQQAKVSNNLAELKEAGFTKGDFRQEKVKNYIYTKYNFVRVRGVGESGAIYFQKIADDDLAPNHAYRQLTSTDAENIVRDAFMQLFNLAPADKIKAAVETLKMGVTEEMESVNNNLIQLTEDLYWDVDKATITSVPEGACMRELFDSRGTNELTISLHDIKASVIEGTYKKVLRYLEESGGVLDPHCDDSLLNIENAALAPFWTWANEDPDTYNDLVKSVATNFMYNKPKGRLC